MKIVFCPRCGTQSTEQTLLDNSCPVCGFEFQTPGDGKSSIFLGIDDVPTYKLNAEMSINNMKPDDFTTIFMLLRIAEALEKIAKLLEVKA